MSRACLRSWSCCCRWQSTPGVPRPRTHREEVRQSGARGRRVAFCDGHLVERRVIVGSRWFVRAQLSRGVAATGRSDSRAFRGGRGDFRELALARRTADALLDAAPAGVRTNSSTASRRSMACWKWSGSVPEAGKRLLRGRFGCAGTHFTFQRSEQVSMRCDRGARGLPMLT